MAQITIAGDTLRVGFTSTDTMFQELYGVGSAAYQVWANTTGEAGWIDLTADHIPSDIPNSKLDNIEKSGTPVTPGQYGGKLLTPMIHTTASGFIDAIQTVAVTFPLHYLSEANYLNNYAPVLLDAVYYKNSGDPLEGYGKKNVNNVRELVPNTTLTSVGDVTLENSIAFPHSKLILMIWDLDPVVGDSDLCLQLGEGTTSTTWLTTDEYDYFQYRGYSASTLAKVNATGASQILLTPEIAGWGISATVGLRMTRVEITNLDDSNNLTFVRWYSNYRFNDGTSQGSTSGYAVVTRTEAIRGLRIYMNTGNIDSVVVNLRGYYNG